MSLILPSDSGEDNLASRFKAAYGKVFAGTAVHLSYNSMNHRYVAFALARITLGINFLGHGLVRLPKLDVFRNWMVKYFEGTLMPTGIVSAFATVLPFIEFALGLFLIIGIFTKQSLIACAFLIMILLFGTCIKEAWDAAGSQMLYALFIALLLFNLDYNAWAIDTRNKPTNY